MSRGAPPAGQALVELALVLPLILLLGCGAVAVVQLSRTQLALEAISDASALVGARGADATIACQQAHQEFSTLLTEDRQLLSGSLTDALSGSCVGSSTPLVGLHPGLAQGYFALWDGYGGRTDTFCRDGDQGSPSDGDFVVSVAYRVNLQWIPLVGSWMSPTLSSSSAVKIDPFRSRAPGDVTGDDC